jgi:hypothetical protein
MRAETFAGNVCAVTAELLNSKRKKEMDTIENNLFIQLSSDLLTGLNLLVAFGKLLLI